MAEQPKLSFDWKLFLREYFATQPELLDDALSVTDNALEMPLSTSQFLSEDIARIDKIIAMLAQAESPERNFLILLLRRLQAFIIESDPEISIYELVPHHALPEIVDARIHHISPIDTQRHIFDYLEGRVPTQFFSLGFSPFQAVHEVCQQLSVDDQRFQMLSMNFEHFYIEYRDRCSRA